MGHLTTTYSRPRWRSWGTQAPGWQWFGLGRASCLTRSAAEPRAVSQNTNVLRISPQGGLFAKKVGRTRESAPHFAI